MIVQVKLWDKTVGNLFFDKETSQIYFKFDKEFKKSKLDIAPLIMPINSNREFFTFPTLPEETYKELPPVFSDSLPDKFGSVILNAYLQTSGKTINDLNPLERLTYVGKRGMGALEFHPITNLPFANKGKIEISDIVDIAKEVLNHKEGMKIKFDSIEPALRVGTSAGGARAKAIIAIDHKTNTIYPGDIMIPNKDVKYYILKIDGVNDIELGKTQGYGRIEYAYSQLARLSGIDMTPTALFQENGRAHFMTERFDRVDGEKIHMQTLNSIALMDYNNPLTNSYEQCFNTMKKMNLSNDDMQKQYRRMVFNVVAKNCDDHTKNISFLMNKKGEWKLSPAYDVTYAYDRTNRWLKQHQMSINGKRLDITNNDLLIIGEKFNIQNKEQIIGNVIDGVSNWDKVAKKAGISENNITRISSKLELDINTRNHGFGY